MRNATSQEVALFVLKTELEFFAAVGAELQAP